MAAKDRTCNKACPFVMFDAFYKCQTRLAVKCSVLLRLMFYKDYNVHRNNVNVCQLLLNLLLYLVSVNVMLNEITVITVNVHFMYTAVLKDDTVSYPGFQSPPIFSQTIEYMLDIYNLQISISKNLSLKNRRTCDSCEGCSFLNNFSAVIYTCDNGEREREAVMVYHMYISA